MTPLFALAAIEGGSRAVEATRGPSGPIEARSPCHFQQVPIEPRLDPLVGLSDTGHKIDPGWVDNDHQVVDLPKSVGELRVVMLGGSALGGWGLPRQAQLAGIVERLLDEAIPDRRVRVINLGKTGWGSPQLTFAFERVASRLDPDLVITVMGNNERMDLANAIALNGFEYEALFARRDALRLSALMRLIEPKPDVTLEVPTPPMPQRWDLPMHEDINGYAMPRLKRMVKRIVKAGDAPAVVCSVPVNHRYHRGTREWWFVGEDVVLTEPYRTAHWAWYHSAPEAGVEAMTQRLSEQPGEAPAHLLRGWFRRRGGDEAGASEDFGAALAALAEADDLPARILRAWATQGAEGAEAASALVAPWVAEARSRTIENQLPCDVPDLLYYAGDAEAAAPEYEACLLQRFYYRADAVTNDGLRTAAAAAGADFFDLDGAVRAASPDGIPAFDTFYDYCHYTPRGNVLAGHLVAAAAAPALGIDAGRIPTPEAGLAAYDEARGGRTVDLPELASWAGASYDVTLLTQLRADLQRERRTGDDDSALGRIFAANRDASTSAVSNPDATRLALHGYLGALALDPSSAVAKANLEAVLKTPAGRSFVEAERGDDVMTHRLRELLAELD
ncbi:MAG: SGNH/GDSL hydrolase family protein [Proteobacteria bacterium]|nr:SGNH/GDSL hydrolase family protein [Pseudomonadota bacterium]